MIERIQGRATFRAFGPSARRVRRGPLTLVVAERDDAVDAAGLAFAVSKRVGNAVVRNRLRRQLRAAALDIDREQPVRPAHYLVVVHPGASRCTYDALAGALSDAFVAAADGSVR